MLFAPFYELLEEVAEKETRTIIIFNNKKVPDGEYGLMEFYCNDPDCDCRRVFLNVFSLREKETLAVIAYGWEGKKFYAQWLGNSDPKLIKEMQGPALNASSPQSKFAPALLEVVRDVLLDKQYVSRLIRHYRMFKEALKNREAAKKVNKTVEVKSQKQVSRNAPCPCGSGKKYKKCCMMK
jgi:hypothetical protein